MKVHEALIEVMKSVPVVKKEDRNTQGGGYNFRGIDAVLNQVGPALRQHGVLVTPEVMEHAWQAIEMGKNKTPMLLTTLKVKYIFVGPEGDEMEIVVVGQAADSGDKGYPKAMSVAFRTALLQSLALPTDERDPDEDTYELAEAMPTPADLARAEILNWAAKTKTSPKGLNDQYKEQFGKSIGDETDADLLKTFFKAVSDGA